MAKADFYETLGVTKTADEKVLKSAFRKLAMKFHPDKNPGDAEAEKKFKELNEAYETLKDPQKRAAYDRFGHAAFEQGGGAGFHPGGGGFGNPFEREVQKVVEDVRNGLVSLEGARLDYGVVITDRDTLTVDAAATAKLRAA